MAEPHLTDNSSPVWPPPPAMPAEPSRADPPPVRPRNAAFEDVALYGVVWTFAALLAFAAGWALAVQSPWGLLVFPFSAFFLATSWPLNVIWLTCIVVFDLVHRAWLGRWEAHRPVGDLRNVRSVMVGGGLGLACAAVACLTAARLHLPGPFDSWCEDSDNANCALPVYAADVTRMIYGASAWVASVAAGWALGGLWARRAARTP